MRWLLQSTLRALWENADSVLYRSQAQGEQSVLILAPHDHATPAFVQRVESEYALRARLDRCWAAVPLALERLNGRRVLILEDAGGDPLSGFVGQPMETPRFLRLAIPIAEALQGVHGQGLVHKDIRPANILVHERQGTVRLTGFGIASWLPRERPAPGPLGAIAGTLAYMAPEQTGRMNRSVDARSDLYALGVTFYELLTGSLPFSANDATGWVQCHIAGKPVPPNERNAGVPSPVAELISKLLAKDPEERYQTAAGVAADLRLCLEAWEWEGRIRPFALGANDTSNRLLIPEKLYGRDDQRATLLEGYDRVAATGTPEFVLLGGNSGVGKSAMVNELQKSLVRDRGFFITGKCEQFRRNIPYAPFAQAFRGLVAAILAESRERVAAWRERMTGALGINAQIIIDLVPELELIIGKQPPVRPLSAVETQNRFALVTREFIGLFARGEHPLTLFLDDLQWLDFGSLTLLQTILGDSQSHYLLVVGTYRDNEVSDAHPLRHLLENLRQSRAIVKEIRLTALSHGELNRLIADALHCSAERAMSLTDLVYEKTAGNPFFAVQFVTELHEVGLLEFDPSTATWQWDLATIKTTGFTGKVVDLMARKLQRLSTAAREILGLAACLRNAFDLSTLVAISAREAADVKRLLWEAVREGLILRQGDVYSFLHDRVQQAAYALIDDAHKGATHVHVGHLLLAQLTAEELDEQVFDVAAQFHAGRHLITEAHERDQIARLNLRAGTKAKASSAYLDARIFFAAAATLLPDDAWSSAYELAFSINMELAECEYLCGAFERADALFDDLLAHAATDFDRAAMYELQLELYQLASKFDEALTIGIRALALFGVTIPEDDDELQAATQREAQAAASYCAGRAIAELARAPEATDPRVKAVIGLLSHVAPAAYAGPTPQKYLLINLLLVNWSLRYGHTKDSCTGYASYGLMLASLYDDPGSAYEFAQMASELNARLGDISRRGHVLALLAVVGFWARPMAACLPVYERALRACLDGGDLVFANDVGKAVVWDAFERGETIDEVLAISQRFAAFAGDTHNEVAYWTIRMDQQFCACLKGNTQNLTSFDDEAFDEAQSLDRIMDSSFMTHYHVQKLIVAFLAEDAELALHHAERAGRTLRSITGVPREATYYFFQALLLCRSYSAVAPAEQTAIVHQLNDCQRKLRRWAAHCPENFFARHALVSAEIARISGRELEAERQYEAAIAAAQENGFGHWESLACELAGRFNLERGFEVIADAYLRRARTGFLRWGALAKVEQLERRYPNLREQARGAAATSTIGTTTTQLDVESVMKALQALSSEIVLEKVIRCLLLITLENADADRVVLVVSCSGAPCTEAEALAGRDGVAVTLEKRPVRPYELPESILRATASNGNRVLLDDACAPSDFSTDPYVLARRPRSVICLPLMKQAQLVGVLYLENRLAPRVFTPARVAVLEVIASQAAISLENARLYGELQRENEERTRAESALRESDARMRFVLANSPDITTYSDREHRYLDIFNAPLPPDMLPAIGQRPEDVYFEADARLIVALKQRVLDTGAQLRGEFLLAPDGEQHWYDATLQPMLNAAGDVTGVISYLHDITERKRAEAVQGRLNRALRLLSDCNQVLVHASDENQLLADICALITEKGGYLEVTVARHARRADTVPHIVRDCPEFARLVCRSCIRIPLHNAGTPVGDLTIHCAETEAFSHDEIALLEELGSDLAFGIITVRSRAEHRAAQERLAFLAHHDPLTGLPNRVLLRDRFERATESADRSDDRVAMLFLDLDRFKEINDGLGHAVGDRLLVEIAERLQCAIRDTDTVSREGGDEFVILLTGVNELNVISRIAQKILSATAEPFEIGATVLHTSFSIGVSIYPDDGRDFETLRKNADTALYHAKDSGRNAYRFFAEHMNRDAIARVQMQFDLRNALKNDEFVLYYQPQVRVADGRIMGMEALVRWRHPGGELAMPGTFIPIAEQSGLILPIGSWVLNEACQQAIAWRRTCSPDLIVAVNLSALQVKRDDTIATLTAALEASGLPPCALELELTESMMLQESAVKTLRALKDIGVKLAIDDFGTGYSSLSYLKRLAVDKLKIDRSFVSDLTENADDAAIVRAIVRLGHTLQLEVVAEGVETQEQLALLRDTDCDQVQGYLFGMPLPPKMSRNSPAEGSS